MNVRCAAVLQEGELDAVLEDVKKRTQTRRRLVESVQGVRESDETDDIVG